MWLTDREKQILKHLLEKEEYVTIEHLESILNVSRRCIYYDIDKINSWLNKNGFQVINKKRKQGFFLTNIQKKEISKSITLCDTPNIYNYSQDERISMSISFILLRKEFVGIENLQDLLDVSRNTIFNDLYKVRSRLNDFELTLSYNPSEGYMIDGKFEKKRLLFLYYMEKLLIDVDNQKISLDFFFSKDSQRKIEYEYERLVHIEESIDVEYKPNALKALAILISFLEEGLLKSDTKNFENDTIKSTAEYQLVVEEFNQFSEYDKEYLATHLFGAKYSPQSITIPNEESMELSKLLIEEFERMSAVEFHDKQELCNKIALHLEWSSYRYTYGVYIDNPLLDRIKGNYSEIFEITNKVCDVLRSKLAAPINESEVGYLTLYFGGYIKNSSHQSPIRILLICAEGSSTSYMLRNEIERLSDEIKVIDNIGVKNLANYKLSYDMIISTVEVVDVKTVIQVHPIITDADRKVILSYIHKKNIRTCNNTSYQKVFRILNKYLKGTELINASQEIITLIDDVKVGRNASAQLGLKDIFRKEDIRIMDHCDSWQDAIYFACEGLINKSIITEEYRENIIKNINKNGPYFVVTDKIALAHSASQIGARSLGLSLLVVKDDVIMVNKCVNMIFVISPIDKESHLNILNSLMKLFKNKEKCEEVYQSSSVEQVYTTIMKAIE